MLEKEDYELKIKKTEEILSNLKDEYTQLIRSKMSETITRMPEITDVDPNNDVEVVEKPLKDTKVSALEDWRKIMQNVLGFSNDEIDNMLESKRKKRAIFKELQKTKDALEYKTEADYNIFIEGDSLKDRENLKLIKRLYNMQHLLGISDDEIIENIKRIEGGEDKDKIMTSFIQKIRNKKEFHPSNTTKEIFEIIKFNNGFDRVVRAEDGTCYQLLKINGFYEGFFKK